MDKKLLGIIGGLGPLATLFLYNMIITNTPAQKDQDHIDTIILSHASIPDRTKYILNQSLENPLPFLIDDARKLESLGVDLIIIPCNTAHFFFKEISNSVNIPILNMIQETAIHLAEKNIKKVALLATSGTISTKLYQHECEKLEIECVLPSEQSQKLVMSIIYDDVKAGNPVDPKKLSSILEELSIINCNNIILGCTELTAINTKEHIGFYFTDALEILALQAIKYFKK